MLVAVHEARWWCVCGLLLLLLAGCQEDTRISSQEFLAMQQGWVPISATQPAEGEVVAEPVGWPTPGPYRVGPGDVVTVTIGGLESVGLPDAHTVRINEQGEIDLPTIGALRVEGDTLDKMQRRIESAYSPKYIRQTQVRVEMVTYRPTEVLVVGEVRTPTAVELRRDRSSIMAAILAAGGPSDNASGLVTVLPAYSVEQSYTVDLSRRENLARASRSGTLNAGDVVIMEQRANDRVFVEGLVNTPGPVEMPRGSQLSVIQAIAAAGGTLTVYQPKNATLLRRQDSGELIRVRLCLQDILAGTEPDLALAPGDVVLVPHGSDTRFEEFLARTFVFRWGMDTVFNPWTHYYFKRDIQARKDENGDDSAFAFFGRQLTAQNLAPLLTPAP